MSRVPDIGRADTTLVLLPGMDGTGMLFQPLLQALEGRMHIQVVRYPGDVSLGYAGLVDHVMSGLPRNGDLVLLGESFSGPVAIELAARLPVRVQGLVLACSFACNPLPLLTPLRRIIGVSPAPQRMLGPLGLLLMGRHTTTSLRTLFAASVREVAPSVFRHRALAALTVDARACLRQVTCPVLYLQATEDWVVRPSAWTGIRALCPRARIARLAGPHFLLQTQPQATAQSLLDFMSKLQQGVIVATPNPD